MAMRKSQITEEEQIALAGGQTTKGSLADGLGIWMKG